MRFLLCFQQAERKMLQRLAAEEITLEDLRNAGIMLELWHAQTNENGGALDKVGALSNGTNEYDIKGNATCQGVYGDCHKKILNALAT